MEKKNKRKNKFSDEYRITDYIICLYLAVIFGLYLNYFDNKYFNITITRYKCFMTTSLIFIAVFLVGAFIQYLLAKKASKNIFVNVDKGAKDYKRPDFWMEMFLVANFFAWLVADDKKAAFTGENGRHLGLAAIAVFFMVYIAIANRAKLHHIIYIILGASITWEHILGICQHHGNDFIHYRDKIAEKSKPIFISTFGNINIYASFICISLPIFLCLFIYCKNIWGKLGSAFIIILSGMTLMICASDSVYLGVGVAVIFIWFISFKDNRITSMFFGLSLMMLGNLLTVIMNRMDFSKHKKRVGLSKTFDNYKFAITILVILIILTLISYFIYKKKGDAIAAIDKKKASIVMAIAMLVIMAVVVIVGIATKNELFVFNDKWGDYRGFTWKMSAEIYSDFPITNKLFGNGNESVKALTVSTHYDEMIKLTGKVYDNCHNEVLQYLLTTGLLGAISYLGVFISTMVYVLKNAKGDYFAYAPLAGVVGYFAQAMVCVNQPITTPLYFVFVAISVGYVRYLKSKEKSEKA